MNKIGLLKLPSLKLLLVLILHLELLLLSNFIDWPEVLFFPWLLSKGVALYKDVVIPYPPLLTIFLEAWYRLFGFSVPSMRLMAYITILVTDVLLYKLLFKISKSVLMSLICLIYFVLWQVVLDGNTLWHEILYTPLFLGVFYIVVDKDSKVANHSTYLIGVLLGIATLIKQTAAWYVIALVAYIWLTEYKNVKVYLQITYILAPIILFHLLTLGVMYLNDTASEYLNWVLIFPFSLTSPSSYYKLLPTIGDIAYVLPIFIPFAISILFIRFNKYILFVLLSMVCLVGAALPRWGVNRMQPMIGFSAVALVIVLKEVFSVSKYKLLLLVIILSTTLGAIRSFSKFIFVRNAMEPQFFNTNYWSLASVISKRTLGNVYIMGNYDYLYLGLNEAPIVKPWIQLLPWNGRLPGIQTQLIKSLKSTKVEYIAYIPYHPDSGYYNDYSPEELSLFIQDNYEKIDSLPVRGGILFKRK